MDSLLQVPRLRITRHSHSPLDDDLSRTPTAGPSRLHPFHADNEDTDSTPRLPVSSSLPSIYAVTDDTPAARLRALLAQVPNTSSASRTQLLHEPPPPLPSDRDSDFDPPPKWANSSTTSSARENLRSLFTHALREPGDTPRKDTRRNSIDSSEVEDSPRIDRVIQERSWNKGKRTSFSDEELETSSKRNTPVPASHAANMEALRSRILGSHPSQSDASMSLASDSSTDNAALIREMHGHAAPAPGISSTSLQTVHLSNQFQSQSNLLDQDSEMQRALGVADSFDSASTNQAPSFPQMAEPSLAARPRTSLVRAGSLTETKLTTNVSRQSEGTQAQRRRYDSLERPSKFVNGAPDNAVDCTPPRERRDSYHHHRSPLPQEFPRQKYSPAQSGGSRSSSRTGSTSSLADFRDRLKDTEKERHYERERAWNMPVSARSRTTSNSSATGHPVRPGLEQPGFRSREHSRPSSPSESVASRATEDEENNEGERNSASPHPTWNHQQQRQRPASPLPSPSLSRVRAQSALVKPDNSDTHTSTQTQSRLRRNPSQSSLTSEGSSRPSSPAELAHRPKAVHQDGEVNHERERNWGSRQQKWTHAPVNERTTSPGLTSRSRVRTESLESDSSAPAASTFGRPPGALLMRQPGDPFSPSRASPRPTVSSPSPEAVEGQKSETSVPSFLRSKPTNGHTYDKPLRMSSRPIRPDSPLAPSIVNGSAEPNDTPPPPAPVPHFGWQFPRNRRQLPDFEPNTTSPEHSPPPVHQSMTRNAGFMKPSHIPVRSPGRVPKIEIKPNGDAKKFMKGHKRATTQFAEANGAIPPRIHFQPEPEPEQESASEPENLGAKSPLDSDESLQDALTPIARPIEIPPPETLQSPSPAENLFVQAEHPASTEASETNSPPTSPRLDAAPTLELSTPPRRPSFSASKIDFQTPKLHASFLSRKNDGLLNLTAAKTPRPPGAWAATPAPMSAPARSQTPQPTVSSIRHSRTRSNSLPQPSVTDTQSSTATPTPHAGTLPARTPAPPGGWFSTPGSLRRKNLMKVRFETAPSDSAVSDADTTVKDVKRAEVSLPEANWDITSQGQGASESMSEPSFDNVESSSPAPAVSISASGDSQKEDGLAANLPVDPPNSTTVGSPSNRRLRRTPSVRLVDEYGRAQEDFPSTPSRKDVKEHSRSMRMPGGGPLRTPRNTSVRILDAMGHELEEPSEQNDSEDTVTEARYTRQEALERMKRAVADLQEGLHNVDTSANGSLDDPRLSELYDLSKAARDMRSKIASSLQQAQTAQIRHKYGSLKESMRKSRFLPNFLPESRAISWNHWLFWWGICSLQFIVFLVMYRMSKIYARHQFLTTYFDPFYANLHLHPTKPEFIYDTNLFSFLRRAQWIHLCGAFGYRWSNVPIQAQHRRPRSTGTALHLGSWGASVNDQVTAWPPT
ncbi:hypothetical protein EI94DRAFT_1736338 [Lactarius quietus]|nr:hypothetical protein EI94DRAFT_1736338 [Lactarius quietus]